MKSRKNRQSGRLRAIVSLSIVVSLCAIAPAKSFAQASGERLMTESIDQSVSRGLKQLIERQQPDGSFGTGAYRGDVGVTALAGMAMMASGSTPGRGPYGENVTRALDYILRRAEPSGFISSPGGGSRPMYGHGFATLFVAECYGMADRTDLRPKLDAAVRLIVAAQNDEGGWRYQPRPMDADISVTACQVMALRAARGAGRFVPGRTVDRAIEYIKRCQNEDGGFMYQTIGGKSDFPRSAAALVALQSAGIYSGGEVDRAVKYLLDFGSQPSEESAVATSTPAENEGYYYYGQYYAALAFWQVGDRQWHSWYKSATGELLDRQDPVGLWRSNICDEYATAMSLIVLQIPNDYLPIFQR